MRIVYGVTSTLTVRLKRREPPADDADADFEAILTRRTPRLIKDHMAAARRRPAQRSLREGLHEIDRALSRADLDRHFAGLPHLDLNPFLRRSTSPREDRIVAGAGNDLRRGRRHRRRQQQGAQKRDFRHLTPPIKQLAIRNSA